MKSTIRCADPSRIVVVLLLGVSACGGMDGGSAGTTPPAADDIATRTSALTTATSHVIVPAYWDSDSPDWSTLTSGSTKLPAGSIVIAPYPGGYDGTLYTVLAALHQNGVIVLGYDQAGWKDNQMNYASSRAYYWSLFYGGMYPDTYGAAVLDGIFFDEADRANNDDVAKMQYLANYVYQVGSFASSPPYLMFNTSAYGEHQYADCILQTGQAVGAADRVLFVSQETSESYYLSAANASNWADSSWNWVNSYKPTHFAQILHDADTGTQLAANVDEAAGDVSSSVGARAWNAAYFYVTSGMYGYNEYGALGNTSVYSELLAHAQSSHSDFGGATTESYTQSCPAACDPSNTACWCAHSECFTGDPLDGRCSPCAQAVCAYDSYCCNNYWDEYCVGYLPSICGSNYSCT